MPVRVYAIVGRSLGRRSLAAIGGGSLRCVGAGPSAVVADCDAAPPLSARALRAHAGVVRRIAKIAPAVLPARFPSVVDSDRAVSAILRTRSAELRAALRLIHKQEQMTLRLFGSAAAAPAPPADHPAAHPGEGAGTRYLAGRAHAQSAPELELLRLPLASLVTAERITRHGRGPLLLTAYHLVPRGAAPAYRRILRRHARALAGRLVTSGPWPAYAFGPEWRG